MTKSPLTWFGSKSRFVKKIVCHFPKHTTYVDVFGGSGAVLLAKKPSSVEIYNDRDKRLYALFNVLSDKNKTQLLKRKLDYTLYSRDLFSKYSNNEKVDDEIELAAQLIVLQRQSFAGLGKTWSYCVDSSVNGQSASVRRFRSGVESLKEAHLRFKKVQVENLCFRDLISLYDRSNTLFYLDPPYLKKTRVNGKYHHEMNENDHVDLINIIKKSKGMFILSGYDNELYNSLLKDWKKEKIPVISTASTERSERKECIWISQSCFKNGIKKYEDIENDTSLSKKQKTIMQTNRRQREDSMAKIKKAISSLKRIKQRVTKTEVSRMTGLSREHISRYYSDLF